MTKEYIVLHSPFDINIHKKTFINYLEVVILEDGTIEYAIPSHQEKLINICCEKLNVNKCQLREMVPSEYYFDFIPWLCKISNTISVWNDFYKGIPNKKQQCVLQELKNENIFYGKI